MAKPKVMDADEQAVGEVLKNWAPLLFNDKPARPLTIGKRPITVARLAGGMARSLVTR